jgi:signal transduction histidine kinase
VVSTLSAIAGKGSTPPTGPEAQFPRLVGIACHDLRTPLATVHGFARTLQRSPLGEPADRYIEMIDLASLQIAELLEELALVARIEAGRYEPQLETVDSLGLVEEAAAELPDDPVNVTGSGAPVQVEVDTTRRALRQLARAARRHGGLDAVDVSVNGPEIAISPLQGTAPGVVTGEDVKELGAAAAVHLVVALGGSVARAGDRLVIRLPG